MSTQHAQFVFLFLVLAVNSTLTHAAHSYALLINNIGVYTRVTSAPYCMCHVLLFCNFRDDSGQFHHTYMFQSEKVKRDWLNTLRCAKLQMSK